MQPTATEHVRTAQAPSLTRLLAQNRHLDELVKECARALASINATFRRELVDLNDLPKLESALEESAAVEQKMQDASRELSAVGQALESELRGRIMVDHQLAAAIEQEEGGRQAAFHDALTGLPNRALFHDRLEQALAQAQRHARALAVMFVDLDDFKIINDSHGHEAGDGVLQAVAQRLENNARGEDTVSRRGGDEFVCLLTEVPDRTAIVAIARKLILAVQAPCNLRVGVLDLGLRVKASIGISVFPQDGATAEALVRSADEAMYKAKRAKSQYSFAS